MGRCKKIGTSPDKERIYTKKNTKLYADILNCIQTYCPVVNATVGEKNHIKQREYAKLVRCIELHDLDDDNINQQIMKFLTGLLRQRRSFKCCGISNSMDGTEDALIFDFDKLKNRVNRENSGREVEDGDNNKENENEIKESDESEIADSNESEIEDSELEEDYYKENKEQTVIYDWSQ
ncbi:hypothetical protein RhiirA5_370116 [Rhizophagus irregularis]|uniref:Uncharacterized protein n=2 Tax=Rhizophagus irregularis TaxID=588596 RepID=A0A2N0QAN6_9GLOM|nr:hypothetical protein RhiirA5_370116 [Rhizophagus irregularis]